ncbi:MAG: hypothetical protein KAG96_00335 [Ichthyobacteriaceae bacterium]|nr:hypothetical protein [Ichthyobacteriaceae bacterium]
MNTNNNILSIYKSIIDYTADLLELGYNRVEVIRYTMNLLLSKRVDLSINNNEYIELENKFFESIEAIN